MTGPQGAGAVAAKPAAVSGPQLPGAILALTPLGYWKLDEPSGTTATDSSGNARNGTYTGSGYTLGGAVGGDGLNYVDLGNGGSSSHIAIADDNVWSIGGSGMSYFGLLKPDSVAGTTAQYWFSKGAASNFEWGHNCNEGVAGRFITTLWTAAGSKIMQSSMSGAGTAWQAVCIAHGAVVKDDPIPQYRNSNSDASTNLFGSVTGPQTNGTAEVRIGWRGDSPSGQYWQGGAAHIAIFAGQLNSTQVGTLMTAADADGWF